MHRFIRQKCSTNGTIQRGPSGDGVYRPVERLEPRVLLSNNATAAASDPAVTVMTQNLYYGGAFDSLFGEGNGVLPDFDKVRATNFPERARALAKEIASNQPQLVGLQEAVVWRTGDVLDGDPATDVEYDFTRILVRALRREGLRYRAVAYSTNADIEVPGVVDGRLRDIRMTDYDVILARADLPRSQLRVFNSRSGNYAQNFEIPVPVVGDIEITRGWASVDATVGGRTIRFINTHLEVFDPRVQRAQAGELVSGPANTNLPVVLVGDFNAGPMYRSNVYSTILGGGFADAWTQANPREAGFTCCQDSNLRNEESRLRTRIDLILYRGTGVRVVEAEVVGDDPADRTRSGLWPSDHAGVVATLDVGAERQSFRRVGMITPFQVDGGEPGTSSELAAVG